jgi:hypothetical protein
MRKYKVHYVIVHPEADWQSSQEVHRHTEEIEARSAEAASKEAMNDTFKREILRRLYPAFHDKLDLEQINVFAVYRSNLADVWVCAEQVY